MRCPNCWHLITESVGIFCANCGINLDEWSDTQIPFTPTVNIIALNKAVITIGRDRSNDIWLDHPAVSKQHARLEWRLDSGGWYVIDEGSAKGTFINYEQVPHGPDGRHLDPGNDTIWIAPYSFRLTAGDQQAPQCEPAHLRLDAASLVRTVKHEQTKQPVAILDLEPTPLSFRPGEFIALVGGSGAGKTTLMKALLGLAPAQNGTVYVNGRPFIQNGRAERFTAMHTVVGYVPQDDVVHRDLTPLEAMDYIARFRLSPDLSRAERMTYIERTLETVDLWPHRDKFIRTLSGGQRKRVNIALELLAQPRLLFLDEPTSGLDPGLDLSIMELLRGWASDHADPRTIILVTHATENVTSCKYVAFMAAGGYVVYFGPPKEALSYFGASRFAEIYRTIGVYQPPALAPAVGDEDGRAGSMRDVQELVDRFQGSDDYFQFVQARRLPEQQPPSSSVSRSAVGERRSLLPDKTERERLLRQFRILVGRYWRLLRRDRMNFATLLLQGFLVAGLLWAVAKPDTFTPKGAEDAQTVLFIMACAAVWLGILNGTKEIVKEQDIYARERRYGLGAVPYVLSKLSVLSLIGAIQIGTLLASLGLRLALPERGALGAWSPAWLEWFVTLELTLVAGLAVGLFVSAITTTVDAATAIMFVLLLLQVMFAGLFFSDAPWADVLSILTFSRWGLEGVGTSADLNGLLSQAGGSAYQIDKAYTFTPLHLVLRWLILGGYGVFFSAAAGWRQAKKG